MADTNSHDDESRIDGENSALPDVGRRSYLGLVGSAVLGAGAATGNAGADHDGWHELRIEDPDEIDYVFTCTGEIQRVQDGSDFEAESADEIWSNGDGTWTCDGYTGGSGYGDTFEFQGECVEFGPMDGDFTLTLDGSSVTADELVQHDAIAIGGGSDYYRKVPPSEATTTVSTLSGLQNALSGASSGDVVYVDPSADIDTGTNELSVPGGVTLASDRGIDGSAGGRLHTDASPWSMLEVDGSGARVTGLRIEGRLGTSGWQSNDDNADMGIDVNATGVEIDNCELYGWTFATARLESDTRFHHNESHHNSMDGWGYGVNTVTGHPIVEWNHFYYNRHSINGGGSNSYTARFNHVTGEPAWAHNFDMHHDGGDTIEIHHNTLEPVVSDENGNDVSGVTIRGTPDTGATIRNNWFYNPKPPKDDPDTDDDNENRAIAQMHNSSPSEWYHYDSWENLEFRENAYGSSEPSAEVGHPRGLESTGGAILPTPVIDDFERASPLDEYGGADGQFGVETATVYEGSQALINASGSTGSAVSTSGLGSYPERGDEITVYMNNASDDNFVGFEFFDQSEQDAPDGYTAGISGQSAWKLWVRDGGSLSLLVQESLPTSDQISGWYRAEIWTDSTTVYADLYDDANDTLLSSIQADDATFSSGGIGFRSAGNGEVWDYAVHTPIEDFERTSPLAEYGGSTGAFGVETSTVYQGDQALINDSGSTSGVASTSGLDGYPDRGDTAVFFVNNAADDNYAAVHLFAQSESDLPNSYSAGLSGQGALKLWVIDDSGVNLVDQVSLSASEQIDGWYRVEMRTDSTTVYADLYDDANDALIASVDADDTTYSSGGIGFRSGGNGEVWDYVYR